MAPKAKIYNTSDVGYMDEEWLDYIPEHLKNVESHKKEEEIKDEQQIEEVQ